MKIPHIFKNNKKILVLKDSYGNAFVPYLASHYEEILIDNGFILSTIGQKNHYQKVN